MTDARLPDRWLYDRRLARLSDSEFRSFILSLLWSVATRTDGHVESADLALIPGFEKGSIPALVGQGVWRALPDGAGWVIDEFAVTQTSRSELERLERVRKQEREKKARQRERKREQESPGGLSPGTFEGTHQEGQEGRTGKDGGEAPSWPVARIPGAKEYAPDPETGVMVEVI